jgi:nucleotide-binding universal stress UspA family protein
MYDSILIPTDGGEDAQMAAEHGIGLAAAFDATVHALYVVDLPGSPRTIYLDANEDEMRERYEEYGRDVTGNVADVAADRGVECVTAIRSGAVHEEIVEYADEHEVDAIVMGTGYKGKLGGLLGSVAEKVVRTAEVPVTTIRGED